MQTFVPIAGPEFRPSLEVLDYRRLGKQRIETKQIYNALTVGGGWQNHPAVKMWRGCEQALLAYGIISCEIWLDRGYVDNQLDWFVSHVEPGPTVMPSWWGDDQVHSSHRANLLRKDPEYYGQFGWEEEPAEGYFWPTPH